MSQLYAKIPFAIVVEPMILSKWWHQNSQGPSRLDDDWWEVCPSSDKKARIDWRTPAFWTDVWERQAPTQHVPSKVWCNNEFIIFAWCKHQKLCGARMSWLCVVQESKIAECKDQKLLGAWCKNELIFAQNLRILCPLCCPSCIKCLINALVHKRWCPSPAWILCFTCPRLTWCRTIRFVVRQLCRWKKTNGNVVG